MNLIIISTANAAVASITEAVKSHTAILSRAKVSASQHSDSVRLLDSTPADGRASRLIVMRARGLAAESCRKSLASQQVKVDEAVAVAIRALHDNLDDTTRTVLVNNIVVAIDSLTESNNLLSSQSAQSDSLSGVPLHHATRTALFGELSRIGNAASSERFDTTLDAVQDFTAMELHSMPVQAIASMQKRLADAIAAVGVADSHVAWYRPLTGEQLAQAYKSPAHRFNAEGNLKASRLELQNLVDQVAALLPTAVGAVHQSMGVPNFKGRVIESGMIICIVANNKLALARRVLAETESRVLAGSVYSDTDQMFERIEDYMRGMGKAA